MAIAPRLAVLNDFHDLWNVSLHVERRVHRNRNHAGAKASQDHLGVKLSANAY